MSHKRIVLRKFSFDENVPPRVIIHDILTFYNLILDKNKVGKGLVLFGYFKRDRNRNIWQVFMCVTVKERKVKLFHKYFLDPSKILFFRFEAPTENIIKKITEDSSKMFSLRSLELRNGKNEVPEVENLFLQNSKFPNLKSFKYQHRRYIREDFPISSTGSDVWHQYPNFFSSLETLFIEGRGFRNRKFFSDVQLIKLRVLSLEHIRLPQPVHLTLHSLENLRIRDSKNLIIISKGDKLKKLSFVFHNQTEALEMMKKSSLSNLQDLKLFASNNNLCWFFEPIIEKKCKQLKKFFFNSGFNFTESDFESWKLIRNQLEYIDFSQESFSRLSVDIFDNLTYDSLKHLSITFNTHLGLSDNNSNWPCSLKLTRMEVGGEGFDKVFQKNEFPNLQFLSFFAATGTGKGWCQFPSLRELRMEHVTNFDDTFFKEFRSTSLEKLSIIHVSEIRGEGWNETIFQSLIDLNLEEGAMDNYPSLSGGDEEGEKIVVEFFTKNEFPKLESLRMSESLLDRMFFSNSFTNWNKFVLFTPEKERVEMEKEEEGQSFLERPPNMKTLKMFNTMKIV